MKGGGIYAIGETIESYVYVKNNTVKDIISRNSKGQFIG